METSSTRKFDDIYDTGPIIGRGTYAEVRSCYSRETLDRFAVKILLKDAVGSFVCDSFLEEAAILRSLDHPNIVKYVDFFESSDKMYLVEEFMPGGDFFDRVANSRRYYAEEEVRCIISSLLEAIMYYHDRNIVHRDLKLENLLLSSANKKFSIKIADFGFARVLKNNDQLHGTFGTLNYMAPEILLKLPHSKPVDIWAAGVILVTLLSGRFPFFGSRASKIAEKIRRCDYDLTGPNWERISDTAKDLVRQMLVACQYQRLSAREALNHPWISNCEKIEVSGSSVNFKLCDTEPLGTKCTEEITDFENDCELRVSYDSVVVVSQISNNVISKN